MIRGWRLSLVALGLVGAAWCQRGDRVDADKSDMPTGFSVPPAVVRTPAEELETFRLQDGLRIELVAAEPLVRDPIVAKFDAAGRLWVVQFETYMRDAEATGELEPNSSVVVLHDDDGDGQMDRSVPFLSNVVLPRAVLPIRAGQPGGGALVILPPDLVFAVDKDGDLVADEQRVVASGFEAGLQNPEHSGNGLLWGLDNRIHLANDARMWRCVTKPDGQLEFVEERGAGGGQWGITQDDCGRLFFNYNADWLRCDLVPGRYASRLPGLRMAGLNYQVVKNQDIWPSRVTPGINRGGRDGMLEKGMLQRNTGVCAPLVYRGDRLQDSNGNVFVCEPCGHLVRRFVLSDTDARMKGRNALDRAEFLTSTDERFRPVNLTQGPDGALYVVDMYRGVIQHRNFVTTFLRKQIEARELEKPIGMGRIWRIVADGSDPSPQPSLAGASTQQLVAALADPCGWRRDTAQRSLVLDRPLAAVVPLQERLRGEDPVYAKIHALSVLSGMEQLSHNDLRVVLHDDDPDLGAFALGLTPPFLSQGDPVLFSQCEALVGHASPSVRWHLALALGGVEGPRGAQALVICAALAPSAAEDPVMRDALVNAVAGREAEFLRSFMQQEEFGQSAAALLRLLGRTAAKSRDGERQRELLQVTAACMHGFAQRAILQGFVDALPKAAAQRVSFFVFAVTPQSLMAMARTGQPKVQTLVRQILESIELRPETAAPDLGVAADDLTAVQRGRIAGGAQVYRSICAACHQHDGRGMAGLAPPLRDSEWVTGDAERLIKIALHGVRGPIEAAGVSFDGEMAGQRHMSNDDLAAVLSWLRRAWDHRQEPVSPAEVDAVRKRFAERQTAWTAKELGDT